MDDTTLQIIEIAKQCPMVGLGVAGYYIVARPLLNKIDTLNAKVESLGVGVKEVALGLATHKEATSENFHSLRESTNANFHSIDKRLTVIEHELQKQHE